MKSHVGIRGSILFGKSPDPCRDSFYLFNPLSKEVCLRRTLIGHCQSRAMSASLIGRLGSSAFRVPTTAVSISLTGSRFSSESAPRPFHYGIRGRGGTIFWPALPSFPQDMTPAQSQQRRNGRSKRTCELTSSIVPRGTSSTARWSSSFLLLDLIL